MKKNISIIGSCISRDIFNDKRLVNSFEVKFYSFQTNIWDMFSDGLNVSSLCIGKIPIENFVRRMIDYDLNKDSAINDLVNAGSEYLLIDMFALFKPCLKITQNNKTVYLKNVRTDYVKGQLEKLLNNAKIKLLNYEEIDEKLIYNGLKKLANFIKNHFDEEKIILHYPIFCEKYCDLENKIERYTNKDITTFMNRSNLINKFTDYLFSLLPRAKKFIPKSFLKFPCAIYRETDNILGLPNPVHLSNKDLLLSATELIKVINLNIKESPLINLLSDEVLSLNNRIVKMKKVIDGTEKNIVTNLNYYVNNLLNLDKYIVLISVKNQAANKLNKFFARTKLYLDMNIKKSQSYVAIVNKKDNFIKEIVSNDKAELNYKCGNTNICLISDYKSNLTSILINDKEYTSNRRGLNFVIINAETFEVEDRFFCDTYIDDYLLISPSIKICSE